MLPSNGFFNPRRKIGIVHANNNTEIKLADFRGLGRNFCVVESIFAVCPSFSTVLKIIRHFNRHLNGFDCSIDKNGYLNNIFVVR